MLRRDALICALLLWGSSTTAAPPSPAAPGAELSRGLGVGEDGSTAAKGRRLTGKFLHITGKSANLLAMRPRV
jgi:endopolyphosphatase